MIFIDSFGAELAHMQSTELFYAKAEEIASNLAIKVGGLALSRYFPQYAVIQFVGRVLDGLGSVQLAMVVGDTASYFLEKKISDQILGEKLSTLILIAKYSLPIITSLGSCHLIYGSTFLTTAILVIYQSKTFMSYALL